MNFQNNKFDNFFKIVEAVIALIISGGVIALSFTMFCENMLTNMFLMGFGFSIFVGAVYMLVSAIREQLNNK